MCRPATFCSITSTEAWPALSIQQHCRVYFIATSLLSPVFEKHVFRKIPAHTVTQWACLTSERVVASLSTNSPFTDELQFADRPAPPPHTQSHARSKHAEAKQQCSSKTSVSWVSSMAWLKHNRQALLTGNSVLMLQSCNFATDTGKCGKGRVQAPRTHCLIISKLPAPNLQGKTSSLLAHGHLRSDKMKPAGSTPCTVKCQQ